MKFQKRVLRLRKEADGFITLNPSAKVIKLNNTAAFMLECCEMTDNTEDLAIVVSKHYGIPFEQAYHDAQFFADQMLKCGLLVVVNDNPQ